MTNVPELSGYEAVADDLRHIAAALARIGPVRPVGPWIKLDIQPARGESDNETRAYVDDVTMNVFGMVGAAAQMRDGSAHYGRTGRVGAVMVSVYQVVSSERDAELEALRARVAELESRDAHGFSRPADGDEPQPTAGRVPPHFEDGRTGAVVVAAEETSS